MEVIRLVDRVGADSILTNAVFEDTVILGPAIVALLDEVKLDKCTFSAPPEVLLIEVPEGKQVTGIIGIRNSVFRRCEFRNIGIIGVPPALDVIRDGIEPVESQATASSSVRLETPPAAVLAEAAPAETPRS